MEHRYFVYLLTNKNLTVLYAGVTNDLTRRVWEHRVNAAIAREKQIKGGSRQKKLEKINAVNPGWRDLYDDLL